MRMLSIDWGYCVETRQTRHLLRVATKSTRVAVIKAFFLWPPGLMPVTICFTVYERGSMHVRHDRPQFHRRPDRTRIRAPRPPRQRSPLGPAQAVPKVPASGKERRRMLKAAVHRLSRLVNAPCAGLVGLNETSLFAIIKDRLGFGWGSGAGEARRLARKVMR